LFPAAANGAANVEAAPPGERRIVREEGAHMRRPLNPQPAGQIFRCNDLLLARAHMSPNSTRWRGGEVGSYGSLRENARIQTATATK
jgi:hypothetical protein